MGHIVKEITGIRKIMIDALYLIEVSGSLEPENVEMQHYKTPVLHNWKIDHEIIPIPNISLPWCHQISTFSLQFRYFHKVHHSRMTIP